MPGPDAARDESFCGPPGSPQNHPPYAGQELTYSPNHANDAGIGDVAVFGDQRDA